MYVNRYFRYDKDDAPCSIVLFLPRSLIVIIKTEARYCSILKNFLQKSPSTLRDLLCCLKVSSKLLMKKMCPIALIAYFLFKEPWCRSKTGLWEVDYSSYSVLSHLLLIIYTVSVFLSLCIFGSFSGKVLAESIDTQRSTRFGGVIPTFAMHFHANRIQHVVAHTLSQARR
jgi:hypothetical protein